MSVSIKNHTNKYIIIAILVVMAIWAALFYAVIMDEVYDNIDDGLKNQKILIIRESYQDAGILRESKDFGVNQFIIYPAKENEIVDFNSFSKEFIYMPYDGEEEPYRVLRTGFYSADGKPYHLEIRTSTVEEDDFLINLAVSLIVLYIVLVLSILVINYFVLGKAWEPFNRILNNLDQYRFGSAGSFVPVKTEVKEFNNLTNHIQKMIQRNEEVFAQQKLFLENASHELQTPLAVTINKLALLLDDPTLNEEQLSRIAEAKGSLHRMVNLNKSLLMLSRIDNLQYSQKAEVNLNEVVHNLAEDLQDIIEFKGINFQVEEKGTLTMNMHPDLALILVSNLFRNAIKYNIPAGELSIKLNENQLEIANSSHAGALNPDYIFNRFYKATQDSNSNGLGLSIVKSILSLYPELKLNYVYRGGFQVFTLSK